MKAHKKVIIGFIITILLLIGAFVAFYLSQKPQEIRQRAAEKPFGKALQLDGETAYLTAPFSDTNSIKEPFTIEGWFKPDFTNKSVPLNLIDVNNSSGNICNQSFQIVANAFSNTANQPNDRYSIYVTHDDPDSNGSLSPDSSYSIPLNNWVHFALSVTSSNSASIYYNGIRVGEKLLTSPLCISSDLKIGTGGDMNPQNFFKGNIDEVRISNIARYSDTFVPASTPFVVDSNTLDLWRFDGTTNDELTNQTLTETGTVSYIESPLPETAPPPACQANISTCAWDSVDTAASYHYKITKIAPEDDDASPGNNIIKEGDIQSPGTSVTFVSEDNATYTCEVAAANVCGTGEKASATATCAVPTGTPTPVPTSSPTPTPTSTPAPSATPTLTPSPTPTKPPSPTATIVPPTSTPVPPIATVVPPTSTPIPPTATTVLVPTNTPIPGVPTSTPTPTLPSPGSGIETLTIAGGIIFTILGALILFVL